MKTLLSDISVSELPVSYKVLLLQNYFNQKYIQEYFQPKIGKIKKNLAPAKKTVFAYKTEYFSLLF